MERIMGRRGGILLLFMAVLLFIGISAALGVVTAQDKAAVPRLSDSQCANCHPVEPEAIATLGGLHRTEVGCQDCHREHPPQGQAAIPACTTCHSGTPHYALENCSSCHTNAHTPMLLTIEGDVTGPCLTCHAAQGTEMQQHPSMHGQVSCTFCHVEHKKVPDCTQCHSKHNEQMTLQDCQSCHPAHQPLVVTYGKETPSSYCGSCHTQAQDLLAKNTSKHHDLSCVQCHRDRHKTVPPCFACHGKPHPDEMLKKFSGCGDCHGEAHDVRR